MAGARKSARILEGEACGAAKRNARAEINPVHPGAGLHFDLHIATAVREGGLWKGELGKDEVVRRTMTKDDRMEAPAANVTEVSAG